MPKKVHRIVIEGTVYKQAQLDELLQEYETAHNKLNKAVEKANKALMGLGDEVEESQKALLLKNAGQAINEEAKLALEELAEATNTLIGHVGMGGN